MLKKHKINIVSNKYMWKNLTLYFFYKGFYFSLVVVDGLYIDFHLVERSYYSRVISVEDLSYLGVGKTGYLSGNINCNVTGF